MKEKKQEIELLLKTAKGQVDAILQMVQADRYCIDVSHQLLAVIALLKKANTKILSNHLHTCVKEATHDSKQMEIKLEEMEQIITKIMK